MDSRFADAIIVAAGSSRRMVGRDKLEEPLLGRPVLAWSVTALGAARSVDRLVVVTRADRVDALSSAAWLSEVGGGRVTVVAGGDERSDSVRAGLAATRAPIVLVHDGARPLISAALVDAVADAAWRHGAAVPVMPVVDSLKRADRATITGSVERAGLVRTQTPQAARRELLLDGFAAAGDRSFSDEAALLESTGVPVATVPGEAFNVKVTEPADLELVRAVAASRQAAGGRGADDMRIGYGQDSHGFGPEMGLWLGGRLMDQAPRLYGHSDGDVVLHALATAVLSASGLGDLGRLFPSSDSSTAGISSAVLLEEAARRVAREGLRIAWARVSIVGARPVLGGRRLDEMRESIAQLLDVAPDRVAVTASTGNLNGAEGAGRVISATALVAVHRR